MPKDVRLENSEIKSLIIEIKRLEDLVISKKNDLIKIGELMKKVSEQIRSKYNSIKELEGTRLTIDNKTLIFDKYLYVIISVSPSSYYSIVIECNL
jgi:hypothetical protein